MGFDSLSRRSLLIAGGASFGLRLFGAGEKRLEGIYPIVQSPFTDADALDLDTLAREVRFLDRCGVHGIVWPQLASEWFTLSHQERIEGAEAVVAAGKKLKPVIVLGVQGKDAETAVGYARHAGKLGAGAIIALPPPGEKSHQNIADYYAAIGRACGLPLFVQAIGDMSVDFILQTARRVPTLRYVKDEAGETLARIPEFRRRGGELIHGVFTGAHGRTLLDALRRGAAGSMPASAFADLYGAVWDHWRDGRKDKAMEVFGAAAMLIHQVSAYGLAGVKYLLEERGVFRNSRCRGKNPQAFDDAARASLAESLRFVKPYLKG